MNIDFISLGSTPAEEPCVQVDSNKDYMPAMRKECLRYKEALVKAYGKWNDIWFTIRSNPHDFGTYLEVAVNFHTDNQLSYDHGLYVEHHTPQSWSLLEEVATLTKEQLDELFEKWRAEEVKWSYL